MARDLKRELVGYRPRPHRFELVDLPPRQYLMVDGAGDPNTAPAYQQALAALYPMSYALKFAARARGEDYVVMPLEGLWWADDLEVFSRDGGGAARDKSGWRWTMMILVPDWLGSMEVEAARERVAATVEPDLLARVRHEVLDEGRCLQVLHLGSYDQEGPTLARLHAEELPSRGLRPTGHHHEIYLGDPRRAAPERLRTILRQPVAPA